MHQENTGDHNHHQDENVIDDSKDCKEDDGLSTNSIPTAYTVHGSSSRPRSASSWFARIEVVVVIAVLCLLSVVIVLGSLFYSLRKGRNRFDFQVRLLLLLLLFRSPSLDFLFFVFKFPSSCTALIKLCLSLSCKFGFMFYMYLHGS